MPASRIDTIDALAFCHRFVTISIIWLVPEEYANIRDSDCIPPECWNVNYPNTKFAIIIEQHRGSP